MSKTIHEYLNERSSYAVASRDLHLMYEVYGEAKMARMMSAITYEQFMEMNTKLVRDGINKPSSYD